MRSANDVVNFLHLVIVLRMVLKSAVAEVERISSSINSGAELLCGLNVTLA